MERSRMSIQLGTKNWLFFRVNKVQLQILNRNLLFHGQMWKCKLVSAHIHQYTLKQFLLWHDSLTYGKQYINYVYKTLYIKHLTKNICIVYVSTKNIKLYTYKFGQKYIRVCKVIYTKISVIKCLRHIYNHHKYLDSWNISLINPTPL